MQLYAIADKMQSILDSIDETGEITPEIQSSLDALEGDLAAKVEAIGRLIRSAEAMAHAQAEEAKRLTAAKWVSENRVTSLKAYLLTQLKRVGVTRVDAGVFRVRVQKNSQPAVTCSVPLDTLPPDLVRRKEVIDLDREAILAAVRDGLPLPDGICVETGMHLRIN